MEEKTFICWPIHSIDTESMDQNKLPFKYLKMTDDGMAKFYQDFELKSMQVSFKTEPLCFSSTDETVFLPSFIGSGYLFSFDVYSHTKVSCILHKDDTIGHVLYNTLAYDTINSTLTA